MHSDNPFDLDVRVATPGTDGANPAFPTVPCSIPCTKICTKFTCRSCTCASCITQCPLAC